MDDLQFYALPLPDIPVCFYIVDSTSWIFGLQLSVCGIGYLPVREVQDKNKNVAYVRMSFN
jgi:hypothetical protein